MVHQSRIGWALAIAMMTSSCWAEVADLRSNEKDGAAVPETKGLMDAAFANASDAHDAGSVPDAIVKLPDAGPAGNDAAGDEIVQAEDSGSADADLPAVVNLVSGGDMENGCAGFSYFAKTSDSADAHSGSHACMVCKLVGAGTYAINFGNQTDSTSPSETYVAEAWVKSTTSAQAIGLGLRNYEGGSVVESKNDGPKPLSTSWMPLEVTFTLTKSGAGLNTYVFVDVSSDGDCFLIDDVVVHRAGS